MIRAIIFDCFGVLNVDGWAPFHNAILSDETKMQQAQLLNDEADAGQINYDDFVAGVSKLADISYQDAYTAMENVKSSNSYLLTIIEQLKTNHKIGMLSNVSADWLKELFTADQISLFDVVALSYDTGYVKPSPQAYYDIANKLGVEVADCLFIDDKQSNCQGARDCGMQALEFKNNEQITADLYNLLADSKS